MKQVDLSKNTFEVDDNLYGSSRRRDCNIFIGEIVTDSDSETEDPLAFSKTKSPQFQAAVDKRAAAIRRQMRRKRSELIAAQRKSKSLQQ